MSAGKGTKLVKGKVGKPKVKKLHLEETLPSPYGRRVVPTITQAMKTDASKKMTKKKKGDADLLMKLEFDDEMGVLGSDGGTGENSLNSSSNTPAPTPAKPKAPRVKQEKRSQVLQSQETPTPKGSSGKKVKKRNPWSEDESKSESDLEDSEPVVIPRDTKSQRASELGTGILPDHSS
ncbi:DNA topoisomerase 2-beta-like [Salvelinus namaycush]|uniref:DNA topoisomerase 2-beta-like n=1 Tax=Salvelinus namaycush TaxID=8040 RepID=A0A8U0PNQ8_SALNM|nr:DNA topoisomerase 2-beta-like [Salvelinus namaycush]